MSPGLLRGRQAEIDQPAHVVRLTTADAGTVILLEGPAGIGKTALLRTARELAASSGFVVCAGECDELDRITPLAPLLTALRSSAPPLIDVADLQALPCAPAARPPPGSWRARPPPSPSATPAFLA